MATDTFQVGSATQIAFVLDNVANFESLVSAFRADVEVHVLDAAKDGLAQIAAILEGRGNVEALHIVGHGSPGSLNLGSFTLDAGNVGDYGDVLGQIGAALAEDGDLLLYGCDVAAGAMGAQFVGRIAQATGADVAASTDLTGSDERGGNWTLEYRQGEVTSDGALDAEAVRSLDTLLVLPNGVQDVTPSMNKQGSGTFVPGFILNSTEAFMPDHEIGGIYITDVPDASFTVSADGVSIGSFDLTGMKWGKFFDGIAYDGGYDFTVTGYKLDGTTVVTHFSTVDGSPTYTAGNYSAFTGISKFTVAIHTTTPLDNVSSVVFDAFTIANAAPPNVAPTFVGSNSISLSQNSGAADITGLLHISDTDSGQTLTWSQQSGPSHGTLILAGATASSGSSDITPGGIITYTPMAGFSGTDNFTVRVSDGFSTVTRTITVKVNPTAPSAPDLASASDTGISSTDNCTNASALSFSGSGALGDSSSTVRVFIDKNGNGAFDAGIDVSAVTTMSNGSWTVGNLLTSALTDGTYNVYAQTISPDGTATSASGAPLSVTLDRTAPTLTITSDRAALKADESATITFTFSEDPGATFTLADVTVTGGTLSALSGTGLTRTAVFTPTAGTDGGVASISVVAGAYTDAAGNGGGGGTTPSLNFDTLAPTLSITSDRSALKAGETATITFTFSEDPGSSFTWDGTSGDIVVSGGTLSAISGSGTTRTAVFTPSAGTDGGTASITVPGGSYTDAAGNSGGAGGSPSISFDTLAPTATVASAAFSDDTGASNNDMITSSAMQTISGTLAGSLGTGERVEVSLDNGASWSEATVAGATWSFAAVLSGSGTLQVRVVDAAGNASSAYAHAYVLDTMAPGAPSTPDLAAASDTGNSNSDNLTSDTTPTFTGTAEAGATVRLYDGATLIGSAVATGGTWSITSSTLEAGTHLITAVATDLAGNVGSASQPLEIHVITDAPATAVASLAFSSDSGTSSTDLITRIAAQTISGTLDRALAPGESVEVSLDGGQTWTGASAASTSWSLSATLLEGTHTILARVADAVGNHGQAYEQEYTLDTVAPSVAITSNVAQLKAGETATITFTFSEDPGATFTWDGAVGDIVVTGGTLSAISGSGLTRTATFTPDSVSAGTASITVGAGSYADAAGNNGAAGATPTLHFDTMAPAAPSTPLLAAGSDTGFSNSDGVTANNTPTFTGTAEAGATVRLYDGATLIGSAVATGGTWSITPTALGDGSHTIIATARDAAGNESVASASLTITIDTVAPTVTITSNVDRLRSGETATITFTFSEDPGATFTPADITVTGGTLGALSGTGTTRTAVFTPTPGVSNGVASITVNAGSYADAAGNVGSAGATAALTFNTVPTQLIDGVDVERDEIDNGDGSVSQVVTIPVVTSGRAETDGDARYADIPLVSAAGRNLLAVQVGVGIGLSAAGFAAPRTAGDALADLIREIEAHTAPGSADQADLTGGGSGFLSGLSSSAPLLVQSLVATQSGPVSGVPLVISGSSGPGAPATALVIDASGLAAGTTIALQNVAFAAIIGSVRVTGGAGSQVVFGDSASQHMVLGADDDTLHGGGGDDYVGSKGGNDWLYGDAGNDTVSGGSGNDRLFGGTGHDSLIGGTGADRLDGGAGNDVLKGDSGNDRLVGGLGRDKLWGGAGNDVFVFTTVQDSRPGAQRDIIYDFQSGRDKIDLRGIDANERLAGNQAFSWIGAKVPFLHPEEAASLFLKAGFTGRAGELRFANGILMGDTDGDGRADFEIKIVGRFSVGDVIL